MNETATAITKLTKGAAGLVTGVCVRKVISDVFKASRPWDPTKKQKIYYGVTTYVLSAMVAEKASEWVEESVEGKAEFAAKAVDLVARVHRGDTTWDAAIKKALADDDEVVSPEVEVMKKTSFDDEVAPPETKPAKDDTTE